MWTSSAPAKLPSSFVRAVEDALLLGGIKEIDSLLNQADKDNPLPEDLRYALESLCFFQQHYGKDGVGEPDNEKEKQTIIRWETLWRQEIIAMISAYSGPVQGKRA